MKPVEMIDKMGHELRGIGALFALISFAAEDSVSCDAISEVSHWMTGHVESFQKFVSTELAHTVGVNLHLPDNKKKGIAGKEG